MSLSNKVLTEGGRVLLENGGSFCSFISQAGNDAQKMVELIVKKIPSYRDEATYEVRVKEGQAYIFWIIHFSDVCQRTLFTHRLEIVFFLSFKSSDIQKSSCMCFNVVWQTGHRRSKHFTTYCIKNYNNFLLGRSPITDQSDVLWCLSL